MKIVLKTYFQYFYKSRKYNEYKKNMGNKKVLKKIWCTSYYQIEVYQTFISITLLSFTNSFQDRSELYISLIFVTYICEFWSFSENKSQYYCLWIPNVGTLHPFYLMSYDVILYNPPDSVIFDIKYPPVAQNGK